MNVSSRVPSITLPLLVDGWFAWEAITAAGCTSSLMTQAASIDWELLPELNQETLKDIGITSAGHRLRILKAARAVQSEPDVADLIADEALAKSTSYPAQTEAERRQLKVMFCDLVGSTSLAEQLDPEDFREIIRSYQDACAGAISRFEGDVARYVGDGLLVYRAAALYDPERHRDSAFRYGHDQGISTDWHLAIALMFLGSPDSSSEVEQRASNLAQELEHANTTLYDLLYSAFTSLVKRDWQRALRVSELMIEDASARSMALWVVFGRHHRGSALAALGKSEEALEEIHKGHDDASRLNHWWLKPMTLRFEALALSDLGCLNEAFFCLDESERLVEATGERWWKAEIHYFRGELNLKSNGPRENSEASFMRAIDVARSQESKLYELRATTSLARLWHSQGTSQEAHDLIFPVHEWFNEGFDTTDLKNAKAFLTELR